MRLLTKEKLRDWKDSPTLFIEDMWGLTPQPIICEKKHEHIEVSCYGEFGRGKHITWQQLLILEAVEKGLRGEAPLRISVAAGHGIGKTALMAMLIIWFLMTRKNAQMGCTAPTADQIHDVLWKELSIWHRKLSEEVQKYFVWQSGYFRVVEAAEVWFARARTARKEKPEAFAGLHGKYVALLGDEASGIENEIYRVAEGSLTDENTLVVLISNFTRLEGYFYDTHNSDKENWQIFSFSSLESPIAQPGYCERIAAKYGEDSDEYRFMVLGLPPKGEGMQDGWLPMFSEDDIANQVPDVGPLMNPTYMGVDPAGLGPNKTVWCVRDAFRAKVIGKEKKSTTLSIAQKCVTSAMHYEVKPENVVIDNFGAGANIAQEIALGVKERVRPINVGHKPRDDRFLNIRAEMYWLLRDWLRRGGKLVKGGDWRQLLTIRYNRTLSGKIRVMSKEDMVKKGWDSPDDADALALSFVPPEAGNEQIREADEIRGEARRQLSDHEVAELTNIY